MNVNTNSVIVLDGAIALTLKMADRKFRFADPMSSLMSLEGALVSVNEQTTNAQVVGILRTAFADGLRAIRDEGGKEVEDDRELSPTEIWYCMQGLQRWGEALGK